MYYGAQEGGKVPIVYGLARRGELDALKACVEQRVRPILICSGPPAPFSYVVLSESDADEKGGSDTKEGRTKKRKPRKNEEKANGIPKEDRSSESKKKRKKPKKGEKEEKAYPGNRFPSSSPPNASPLLLPTVMNPASSSSSHPLSCRHQGGEEEDNGHEAAWSADYSIPQVMKVRGNTDSWRGGDEYGRPTDNDGGTTLPSSEPSTLSPTLPPPTSILEALLQCTDRRKTRLGVEWVVKSLQSQTKQMERQALKKEKKWEKEAKKKDAAKHRKEETKETGKQQKKKEREARHQKKGGEEEMTEKTESETTMPKEKKKKKNGDEFGAEHTQKNGKTHHHHSEEDPWEEAVQSEKAEMEKGTDGIKGSTQKHEGEASPFLDGTDALKEQKTPTEGEVCAAPTSTLRTSENRVPTSEGRHVEFETKTEKKKKEKKRRKKKSSHATIDTALIHVNWLAKNDEGMDFLNQAAEYHRLSDVWPAIKNLAEFKAKNDSGDGNSRIVLQTVGSADWKKLGKGDQKRFQPLNIITQPKEKKAFHFFSFASSK